MAKPDRPQKKMEQKRLLTEVLGKPMGPDTNTPATRRSLTGSPPGKKFKDLPTTTVTPMDMDTAPPLTNRDEQPLNDVELPPVAAQPEAHIST